MVQLQLPRFICEGAGTLGHARLSSAGLDYHRQGARGVRPVTRQDDQRAARIFDMQCEIAADHGFDRPSEFVRQDHAIAKRDSS
jgi:hypothetical protein